MTSRTRAAALAALAPLLLAGCGHGSKAAAPATSTKAPAALPTTLLGNVEELHPGTLTAQDIATSQQRFGLDLMAKVCGKDGPNTLLSPASAAEALGMLDAAAAGPTGTAVSKLLHLPAWSPAVVAAVHDHRVGLDALATGKGDTLRTSNRVWPSVQLKPTSQFLDDVQTAYGAAVRTLDYGQPQQATDTVNKQVSADTDGLIPKLFDQPLDADTVAVLTDALVLKAKWREPLLLEETDSPFAGGHTARMMRTGHPVTYASVKGWQSAQIPYESGTLAAVAILPPVGSAPCALPTATDLKALTATTKDLTDVSLPRLHLDQSHDLLATLTAMGLPVQGDFSGLDGRGAFVSEVVQKDVMKVDELGTVAAGATGVAIAASGVAGPIHQLSFDRPFLLLLEDVKTHTPLFLASVGDPASS